jgi:hypothetical protein
MAILTGNMTKTRNGPCIEFFDCSDETAQRFLAIIKQDELQKLLDAMEIGDNMLIIAYDNGHVIIDPTDDRCDCCLKHPCTCDANCTCKIDWYELANRNIG